MLVRMKQVLRALTFHKVHKRILGRRRQKDVPGRPGSIEYALSSIGGKNHRHNGFNP